MARNKAMLGPGSAKMGGAGIKAGRPSTAMAGSGLGAPKGGLAAGMGAPPMAPKVANVRPPGMGAGAPPPMPGGGMGAGPPPPPPGGMGGSGGFAKGGSAIREEAKQEGEPPAFERKEQRAGFARGGSVGGDTKSRHKGTVHKGR